MHTYQPLARLVCLALLALGQLSGQEEARSVVQPSDELLLGNHVVAVPAQYEQVNDPADMDALDAAMPVPIVSAPMPQPPEMSVAEAMDLARAEVPRLNLPYAPKLNWNKTKRVYRICRVTAYCDRGQTAAGCQAGIGQCAAPGYIPLGSKVYIPELDRTFLVTDRTHKRFRQSTVDIFIPSRRACKEFGRSFLEVEFIVPEVVED